MVEFSCDFNSESDENSASMPDTEMGDQQNPSTQQLMAIITDLSERLNQQQAPATTSATEQTQRRPRPALPDPEAFDGHDRAYYPQFKAKLQAKLAVDNQALGGPNEQLWYAYSRLNGPAAVHILPWMTTRAPKGALVTNAVVEGFFEHMDFTFLDKDLQEKALAGLSSLHQGNHPFHSLLSDFQHLLMEAGGHAWDDQVKCAYLDNTLNREMKDRLMTVEKKERFEAYCRQLQQIASRLEEQHTSNSRQGHRQPFPLPQATQAPVTDTMDWEPTLSKLRQRRARWVDAAEIAKRRQEKRCVRCGSPGHFVRDCIFQPPTRPRQQEPNPQVQNMVRLVETADLEPESVTVEESEKV